MIAGKANIAVVGCGYWGKNVVRNFHDLGALSWVCDVREAVANEARTKYQVRATTNLADVLADVEVQGVAIAAPAAEHYRLAVQ